ncbi:hypothetical protein [Photobacterium damselae]|uniref:hypothetical protein n=1 Tax=Photobacterium damselae TaxID=38293 RepID=UPI0040679609
MPTVKKNRFENTVVSFQMQDWELSSDSHTAEAVTDNCKTKFVASFEFDESSNSVWFKISDKSVDDLGENESHGMAGRIEIRNGAPSISIGMHPDDSQLSVMSNGLNELSIVPDCGESELRRGTVEHTPQKYDGFILELPECNIDVLEYRKQIANKHLRDNIPDFKSEIMEVHWQESKSANTLVSSIVLPNASTTSLAIIEFSDRSVGHILNFIIKPCDIESNKQEMYSLLSDNELIDVIVSHLSDEIENKSDNLLWDEESIVKIVYDKTGFNLKERSESVTHRLFLAFNKCDLITNTFTVGNTYYHIPKKNIELLSSTDTVLLHHLGYNGGHPDIKKIRTEVYNDFSNDIMFAVDRNCCHKNPDGSCAGHQK